MVPRSCRFLAVFFWSLSLLGAVPPAAQGFINVEFRALTPSVEVGQTARIGIFVVSDRSTDQLMSAAQIIVRWDTAFLRLLGNHQIGATPLLSSGFPVPEPYGLNEANPPQDGLGVYFAFSPFGMPTHAVPEGTLLTTLTFESLHETASTPVEIVVAGGNPLGRTTVFDGTTPNTDVTGTLTGAGITIVPAPAAGLVVACLLAAMAPSRRRRASRSCHLSFPA